MVKRRYYHYPSPIAINKFNTQVLRAVSTKLSRDYLGFFGNISKMYMKGELKKEAISTISKVKKSIALLDSMISATAVSKSDMEILMKNVDEINKSKEYFLSQAEQNKSFDVKLQKISETTGISSQDLSITKEIMQKGAAQVRRRTREGAASFLKRTMPGTLELAAEGLKGGVTAMMGPFAPIAGMAGTVLKDIWGVGSTLREGMRTRREEKLAAQLSPMVGKLKPSTFEKLGVRRPEQPIISGFRGVQRSTQPVIDRFRETARRAPLRKQTKEEAVFPLTYFFDKKAHKVKWTKEVLDRFKAMEKKLGLKRDGQTGGIFGGALSGVLGDLPAKLGLFTAGLAPLIGPAGKLMGLGAATLFAANRLNALGGNLRLIKRLHFINKNRKHYKKNFEVKKLQCF